MRKLLVRMYVGWWLYRGTATIGQITLRFFRLIYSELQVGPQPKIWGRFNLTIFQGGRVTIGAKVHMVSAPPRSAITLFARCSFTAFPTGTIEIGDNVGLNGTAITSKKHVRIGDGTMIAPNVIIVDSDFHAHWPPDSRLTSSTAGADREVVIGRNVWIGMNSIVLKGSRIGDGSIIGAGSVVAGEIPPNVIASGNPARVLKPLCPEEGSHE
jgi:acetyltransferase-like isoleucine patch superfamily enzyme